MNTNACLFVLLFLAQFSLAVESTADIHENDMMMANPAAVYCSQLGYEYKIVKDSSGEYGVCVFPDKTQCDEWRFLEGKCGQSYSYCAKQGYGIKTASDGKDPFSREYAVCMYGTTEVGSVSKLLSLSEKAAKAGATPISETATEYPTTSSAPTGLPSSFDWRNYKSGDWMTSVKDQGQCGSCWAFSAVGVAEAAHNIFENNPNLDLDLSEEYLVSNCTTSGSCCGGSSASALSYIRNSGIPDELCLPYADYYCSCSPPTCSSQCVYRTGGACSNKACSDRCTDWATRLKNISRTGALSSSPLSQIKQKLVEKGPISVAMCVGSSCGGYWDGDIYRCSIGGSPNHAVIITGYNDINATDGYWIIKNSWGASWNGDGYFKLGYGECNLSYVYYGYKCNETGAQCNLNSTCCSGLCENGICAPLCGDGECTGNEICGVCNP
ncbi:MAG: C1 family peptidase, partial [Candidatus Micrarchaeota archaeon]